MRMSLSPRRPEARAGALALGVIALGIGIAATPAVTPEREKELVVLVRQDCGSCHGMTLKGGLGRPLAPQALRYFDDATLAAVILDGVPGTPMPPWRGLITETEAHWIAHNLIKGFPE